MCNYYRDAARFRLRYLIMQAFALECCWNARRPVYYRNTRNFDCTTVEYSWFVKSIDIAYYFPFSSKLFFNYLSRTTASARLELRFSLPLIVRSGEHSLEWRFSQGACRRWRPRSDDSDGREWFQLSIIPMLLRLAIATTFLHLSRNCSQLVLAFDNAVTISLRPLAIYFPDSSIISFYRSRIRTNLFRDRVFTFLAYSFVKLRFGKIVRRYFESILFRRNNFWFSLFVALRLLSLSWNLANRFAIFSRNEKCNGSTCTLCVNDGSFDSSIDWNALHESQIRRFSSTYCYAKRLNSIRAKIARYFTDVCRDFYSYATSILRYTTLRLFLLTVSLRGWFSSLVLCHVVQ